MFTRNQIYIGANTLNDQGVKPILAAVWYSLEAGSFTAIHNALATKTPACNQKNAGGARG